MYVFVWISTTRPTPNPTTHPPTITNPQRIQRHPPTYLLLDAAHHQLHLARLQRLADAVTDRVALVLGVDDGGGAGAAHACSLIWCLGFVGGVGLSYQGESGVGGWMDGRRRMFDGSTPTHPHIYIHTYTPTHTHTYILLYIYIGLPVLESASMSPSTYLSTSDGSSRRLEQKLTTDHCGYRG